MGTMAVACCYYSKVLLDLSHEDVGRGSGERDNEIQKDLEIQRG